MKDISTIASLEQLREISFSDLYYSLENKENKADVVKRVIAAIDSGFIPTVLQQRRLVILLSMIRDAVEDKRMQYQIKLQKKEEELEKYKQLDELCSSVGRVSGLYSMVKRAEELKEIQKSIGNGRTTAGGLGIKIKYLNDDELFDQIRDDFISASVEHIDALVADDERYSAFMANLNDTIQQQLVMSGNKVLKGLYMLPLLGDDQELIIFFGSAFHATFSNTDAYTGLLYASEYFEHDGSYLGAAFLQSSEEEKTQIVRDARNARDYEYALRLLSEERYDEAAKAFDALGTYKNSKSMSDKALAARDEAAKAKVYQRAIGLLSEEEFDKAAELFEELGDYSDSLRMLEKTVNLRDIKQNDSLYSEAERDLQESRYLDAENIFLSLGEWRDAPSKALAAREAFSEQQYKMASELRKQGEYDKAIELYSQIIDYSDSKEQLARVKFEKVEDETWREREEEQRLKRVYDRGKSYFEKDQFEKAARLFCDLGDYEDAPQLMRAAQYLAIQEKAYSEALTLQSQGDYQAAAAAFSALKGEDGAWYRDSRQRERECQEAYEKALAASYEEANLLMASGKYRNAELRYKKLSGYRQSDKKAEQASLLLAATKTLLAGQYTIVRQIINNPAIAALKATEEIGRDIQEIETLLKQVSDKQEELNSVHKELTNVQRKLACNAGKQLDLEEGAVAIVPSQKEYETTCQAIELIRLELEKLGLFEFKKRRALESELHLKMEKRNKCIAAIPVEKKELLESLRRESDLLNEQKSRAARSESLLEEQVRSCEMKLLEIKGKYQ